MRKAPTNSQDRQTLLLRQVRRHNTKISPNLMVELSCIIVPFHSFLATFIFNCTTDDSLDSSQVNTTMSHPLDGWLPNDARWSQLPTADLRKQCAVRDLLPTGLRKELLQRILTYKQVKSNTPATKRHHLWQVEPSRLSSYQKAASTAETTRFELARVVDKPLRKEGSFRRDFRICDRRLWLQYAEGNRKKKYITVSIGSVLKCTCPSPVSSSKSRVSRQVTPWSSHPLILPTS